MARYNAGDMSDVMRYNRMVGQHFFNEGTMLFWGSKIESTLYQNNTFVTSEYNFERTKRLYTVRLYDPETARIKTIGGFQQFKDKSEAKRFAICYKG